MKKMVCKVLAGVSLATVCVMSHAKPSEYADTVYLGENIVTMDPAKPSAEAVAIRDEKIVYVGKKSGVKSVIGDETDVVKLGKQALLPGLIDAHGHFSMVALVADFVNASSPPVGEMESIDDIVEALKQEILVRKPAKGEWIFAYGYDDSLLAENRHPTREDLDKVSKDIPIFMLHVSGHLGAANSAALQAVSVGEGTPNPDGGVFRRFPGTTIPNGVVEEKAAYVFFAVVLAKPDPQTFAKHAISAEQTFAQYGVTTVQDGAAMLPAVQGYRALGQQGLLSVDIGAYPSIALGDGHSHGPEEKQPEVDLDAYIAAYEKAYVGGVRVAGIKLMLDGSPQGRTAWLTEPYNELPEGAEEGYVAYPTSDPVKYKATAKTLLQAGVPIIVHCNGDAAIDLMLDSVEEAFKGQDIPDHRSVIIHAQLMRQDQLERAKKLKVIPSFYSAHPFFWGDWHRKSFGEARASNISPTAAALALDLPFTIHNDSPIVPPDMMRLLWITVNRKTRSGYVLGAHQRIDTYDALHAMTLGAAYQYFEEDTKGSITVGKQADLVILDQNPLETDPDALKDIKVMKTIAKGKTLFSR